MAILSSSRSTSEDGRRTGVLLAGGDVVRRPISVTVQRLLNSSLRSSNGFRNEQVTTSRRGEAIHSPPALERRGSYYRPRSAAWLTPFGSAPSPAPSRTTSHGGRLERQWSPGGRAMRRRSLRFPSGRRPTTPVLDARCVPIPVPSYSRRLYRYPPLIRIVSQGCRTLPA